MRDASSHLHICRVMLKCAKYHLLMKSSAIEKRLIRSINDQMVLGTGKVPIQQQLRVGVRANLIA